MKAASSEGERAVLVLSVEGGRGFSGMADDPTSSYMESSIIEE
jgi:hypothetical protein